MSAIDFLSLSRLRDVFGVLLCKSKPFLWRFFSEIVLDDEITIVLQQDTNVFNCVVSGIHTEHQMKQIRELQDFVKKQPVSITEFDETLVSRLIEKITVFEDHFTVRQPVEHRTLQAL